MLAGHSLQPVLSAEGLQALSSEWRALSEEVGLTLGEVMTALAVQLTQPGARCATQQQISRHHCERS